MICDRVRAELPRLCSDLIETGERRHLLAHLRDCDDCRRLAARRDPTIAFSLLPAEEISDEDVGRVARSVHAMRRMRELEAIERRRPVRRAVGGLLAAMVLVAVILVPRLAREDEPDRIPFAGAVGVGSGLVQMPGNPGRSADTSIQLRLLESVPPGTAVQPGEQRALWQTEIPVRDRGRVTRDLGDDYRLHFDLTERGDAGVLQIDHLEILRSGPQGEETLLARDLRPQLNRPVVLELSADAVDRGPLWLELTWADTTLARR